MTSNVFTDLDRDWRRLAGSRAAARQLADVRRVAGSAQTLADVEQYVRRAGPAEADRVLLALVARAVEGDGLAARVLLQLLLPGTRNLARRWWALGDHDERAAAAVAAVYQRIRRYPLARRPGRVAANVLMDASRDMRNAVPRPEVPALDPADDAAATAAHPGVELTEVLCDAVHDGLLAPAEATLIARSRISGHRLSDLAVANGIPERTLFAHRQRAERRLATAYAAGRE
ncbi:MAG TPA: hypothetical protein VK611_27165 [Acidimicrobiales bacterium]|nr:hypothetical protein [Acidimicrobiales bacterium]